MPPTNRKIRLKARSDHKDNTKRVTRGNARLSAASANNVRRHHAAATRRVASPARRNRSNCVGNHCSSSRLGAGAAVVLSAAAAGLRSKNYFNRANTLKHTHHFGGPPHKSNFNNSPKKYRTGKVPSNHTPFSTYNKNAANAYKRAANAHQSRRKGEKIRADVLGKKARRPTALHLAGRTK